MGYNFTFIYLIFKIQTFNRIQSLKVPENFEILKHTDESPLENAAR